MTVDQMIEVLETRPKLEPVDILALADLCLEMDDERAELYRGFLLQWDLLDHLVKNCMRAMAKHYQQPGLEKGEHAQTAVKEALRLLGGQADAITKMFAQSSQPSMITFVWSQLADSIQQHGDGRRCVRWYIKTRRRWMTHDNQQEKSEAEECPS